METPPIVIVGMVGYIETPRGMRALKTVWAQHISDECKRRFYTHWNKNAKAFSKYAKRWAENPDSKTSIKRDIERIKKYCSVIRVIAQSQVHLLGKRQKKAHIFEIQLNGGKVDQKVKWAEEHLEKQINVADVFAENEMIDVMGVTTGKGVQGVVKRFHVRRLPRKTHRGIRRVGCIGAWQEELAGLWQGLVSLVHSTEQK